MLDLTQLDDAVRHEGGISRRLFLAYSAALAATPTLSLRAANKPKGPPKFKADPFSLGIASGDPSDDGFALWTRLAPQPLDGDGGLPPESIEVQWVVASDEAMKKVLRKGTADATSALGHSVHVEVEGLKADAWYWYQFHCGGASSPVGRTRTMPLATASPERLKFAFASCQNYEDGLFTAYRHMAKEDLDLVVHLGDYIYEGGAHDNQVRRHLGAKLKTLADYRIRHSLYRTDSLLQLMHVRCPWVVTWDDHEFEGNYANATSKEKGVNPAEFLKRRASAYQAYYEMMPLRARSVPQGPNLKLYRTVTFGRLAAFQVLDTRQYRTDQPNGDDAADLNGAALNPKNTMLGAPQRDWLQGALVKSKATWNVLAQQVMMGMVDRHGGKEKTYSMDAWPGYAFERMKLIQFLAEHRVSNPVVLTGDIHSNWLNNLRVDDRRPELPVVATEFVGTSISSKGNGTEVEAKRLDRLFAENPCLKFHNDQRGYVRCTVTRDAWRSDFQAVSEVAKPGGTLATKGSFIVRAGKAGAIKA